MCALLAVDLGLRTGLALYGRDGRLRWYRSRHFGTRAQLKRGVHGWLADMPDVARVVIEGGGPIAEVWKREGERRGIPVVEIAAEDWRARLLKPSERRGTDRAKGAADVLARKVIVWSGADRPTSLRHDAAEAILIGLWGVLEAGWLGELPRELEIGPGG